MKYKLFKNFFYNSIYQILGIITPFITSPYIARVLGAEKVGIYSYTYSIVYYFGIFATLGISTYGTRLIARYRKDNIDLNIEFSSLSILHIALSCILLFVYYIYVLIFVDENKEISFIQSLYIVSILFDFSWLFAGMEEFKITATRSIIIKLVTTVLIFIFVNSKEDLWIYALIITTGNLVGNISICFLLKKYVRFAKTSLKKILSHLRPMCLLTVSVIAVSVYLYLDKVMLGIMADMSQVGIYENAFKAIDFPMGLITAFGTVMLPHATYLVSQRNFDGIKQSILKTMKVLALIAPPMALGMAAISNVFSVVFWGQEFASCASIMKLLCTIALLITWNNVIRTQYLIPFEKDKYYVVAVAVGALVDAILNALLIPLFGANGAAIGTVGAYFAVFMIQNLSVRKELAVAEYLKAFLPFTIFGVVMFAIIISIDKLMSRSVISLFAEIFIGMGIYLLLTLVYIYVRKEKFYIQLINEFTSNLKNKLMKRNI